MNEQTHTETTSTNGTPQPWIAAGFLVEHPRDDIADICSCNPADFGQIDRDPREISANARRIAACVNALRDFSTDFIEQLDPTDLSYAIESVNELDLLAAEVYALCRMKRKLSKVLNKSKHNAEQGITL